MLFSNVTGYIKDKFRNGTRIVSISKVKALGNDSQILHCFAPGVEVNPVDDSNLVFERIGGFTVAVGGVNQDIEPNVDRGELRFYSTDDTGKVIKSIIKFKNDGTLELNGASSYAVKFEELETAIDDMKDSVNNALALKLDGAGNIGGVTVNITPAKSDSVKLS